MRIQISEVLPSTRNPVIMSPEVSWGVVRYIVVNFVAIRCPLCPCDNGVLTMFLSLVFLVTSLTLALCQGNGHLERRNSTGLTDSVTWDSHSLFIHGQRVFVLSAEAHPWRLPNPDLWADVLQKVRANGFNTVSFCINWALHYPTPGSNSSLGDFQSGTFRDIQRFIDEAKGAGLWLIARSV